MLPPTQRPARRRPPVRSLRNSVCANAYASRTRARTFRSLYCRTLLARVRHTYICLRLLEGADVYQIAKNCRTSIEMIEKYYAVHLKNTLDAAAINVRKSRVGKARKNRSRESPDDCRWLNSSPAV
jgi:hypothetical protein